jgi:Zn-dependent peptidase ImmA (M78 family)
MPPKHPSYPFVEPGASRLSHPEIEALADRNARDWGYRDRKSLDEVCKGAGVEIEYSHYPNEIMLEVPLEGGPVIWLPRKARKRDDRVTVATALGHWSLHVDKTREANPHCGIQALYEPTSHEAFKEAVAFGLAFLMPREDFLDAWYVGRAQAASDRFDVPTKMAYFRAEILDVA